MAGKRIFIDRRRGDRRTDPDPCRNVPMDLYHRKRRKSTERRNTKRTLVDDYYAFTEEGSSPAEAEPAVKSNEAPAGTQQQ